MKAEAATLSGTLASDAWRRVSDLVGLNQFQRILLLEATVQVQDNDAVLGFFPDVAPVAGQAGQELAAGQTLSLGPTPPGAAWPLNSLWVRNRTAGANASLVITGRLGVL